MNKKKIKIKLIYGAIGRSLRQKETVKGLGFTKRGQTREIVDNPSIRGMIRKVSHLVEII